MRTILLTAEYQEAVSLDLFRPCNLDNLYLPLIVWLQQLIT